MKVKNTVQVCIMAALLLVLSLWGWLRTPDEYSEDERRLLATMPELRWESVLSGDWMADFETYTQDQFPLRDGFRTLKAVASLSVGQLDNNDLYLADGHLSKMDYPLREPMLDHAAERFQYVYDTYLTEMDVYLSIVPDKNAFLAEENGRLALDYDRLTDEMRQRLPQMTYIDVSGLLSLEDYYTTDSHWRQEEILDVAEALAAGMGVTLPAADYTTHTVDTPFYGVYHGQAALPVAPDTLRYLTSPALDGCTVTSYDTGKPEQQPVYDMESAAGRDPYEMFLSGPDALQVIENPAASTDRELIVFRDSFGSSLVPLLVEGYAKITLVDLRYVQSAMLGHLIDFADQDVLFLYSTVLLNNSLAIR